MNPDQLWETTMNPATRKLERLSLEDAEKCEQLVSLCMGEEVAPRREFIMNHADNVKIDC